MERDNTFLHPENLPFHLEDIVGELVAVALECPGVYYISAVKDHKGRVEGRLVPCDEYYVVMPDAAAISKEARSSGKSGPHGLLLYPLYQTGGGWKRIEYEVHAYRMEQQLPVPEGTSLLDIALEGMEEDPAYFGAFPVPAVTPWGYTLRHKTLENGIYWLETNQRIQALAVRRSLEDELSNAAVALAAQAAGPPDPPDRWGYLFFTKQDGCIPLFELMQCRPALRNSDQIDAAALVNAIAESRVEYLISYNAQEQMGLHNLPGLLFQERGVPYWGSSSHPPAAIQPEAGLEYFNFLK